MKKLILVLAIALMAVPAFAVDVALQRVGTTDVINVVYTGNGADAATRVRAFALDINSPVGTSMTLVPGSFYQGGESRATGTGAQRNYGIFPSTITIVDGVVTNVGSPLSSAPKPGAGADGTNHLVLEFGSLYFNADVNAPLTSNTLCSFTFNPGSVSNPVITMKDELIYRGGIVFENGTQNETAADKTLTYITAVAECMKNTAAGYANWVAAGNPDCWCYQYQGLGDIDGKDQGSGMTLKRIGGVDLTKFVAGFNKKRNLLTGELICADIDHLDQGSGMTLKAVGGVDLAIFVANYNKKTSQLPDPVPYAADYNFWKVAP